MCLTALLSAQQTSDGAVCAAAAAVLCQVQNCSMKNVFINLAPSSTGALVPGSEMSQSFCREVGCFHSTENFLSLGCCTDECGPSAGCGAGAVSISGFVSSPTGCKETYPLCYMCLNVLIFVVRCFVEFILFFINMMPLILRTEQFSAATYLWAVCATEVLESKINIWFVTLGFLEVEGLGRADVTTLFGHLGV